MFLKLIYYPLDFEKKKNFTYLLFQFPINSCKQSIFISLLLHFCCEIIQYDLILILILYDGLEILCEMLLIMDHLMEISNSFKKRKSFTQIPHERYIVMKIYLSFKYNIKNEISKKNSSRKNIFCRNLKRSNISR